MFAKQVPRRVGAMVFAGVLFSLAGARATITRTFYFVAIDSSGAAVMDLAPADLSVKEGGKDRAVESVKPATAPMDVAVIVDDGGTGAFQPAVAEFLNRVQDHGVFSIRLVNTQALRLQDYTSDTNALHAALEKIGKRGRVQPDGDQLLEGVSEAAKELGKRKAARPVIVVFTVFGENHQSIDPENVLRDLKNSAAQLHVMYVTGAQTGQMLGDGPRQSGGRVDEVPAGGGIIPGAARIAETLLHQMIATYTLPDGVKPADRLAVTINRKGVSLMAPTRIPDK
jgi:hypothetical protein